MAKFNAGQVKRLEASRAMDSSGIQDAIADKIQVGLTQENVFDTEEVQGLMTVGRRCFLSMTQSR
jgi:hypothetical protein